MSSGANCHPAQEKESKTTMPGDSPPRCMPGDQVADIPRGPGSYVLVLWMAKPCPLAIGSLGRVTLPGGFLLYTGSARGGLRGRLQHYLRRPAHLHWHIDYLMQVAEILEIWYAESPARLECVWAGRLRGAGLKAAIRHFGSSDCRCPTHLFHANIRPSPDLLAEPDLRVITLAIEGDSQRGVAGAPAVPRG